MREVDNRREFLKTGAAAAATGAFASRTVQADQPSARRKDEPAAKPAPSEPVQDEYDGFSRYRPSRGADPDSDFYIGKLVPGFRGLDAGNAPFTAPDLEKLPFKMKDGVKEYHLVVQPVTRELLPGYWMNFYGYNGSMPGPTIEVTQGDRVRFVVTNELTEETVVHWHGVELPVQFDGAHSLTQNPIKPGKEFVYEFSFHEEGTFFYHSHVPMQEAFGQVGWLIVHPRKPWTPPVDRDVGLIFQNFRIRPNQTISDSWEMDWNWHTINGRSGPYATPIVCKHGERVRLRILDFAPMQHHPIHLHGHTFWITGHEGARIPKSAWVCRNTQLIAVAQASMLEFVANNPGDWMLHCHMVHHMMNHMVRQVGPRIRENSSVDRYLADLETRPPADISTTAVPDQPPGYPQKMLGMTMSPEFMMKIWSRREVQGMRAQWPMSVSGMMTVLRVLPADLYDKLLNSNEKIEKGAIFKEIVRRFGDISTYQPAPKMMG